MKGGDEIDKVVLILRLKFNEENFKSKGEKYVRKNI